MVKRRKAKPPEANKAEDISLPQLAEFATALQEHKEACEQSGRYDAAELAGRRLAHIRTRQEALVKREFKQGQRLERRDLQDGHLEELRAFNEFWDLKAKDFEEHVAGLQVTLKERHEKEFETTAAELRETLEPRAPRWSKELLALRRTQEILSKGKQYSEASKAKAQGDLVEQEEFNKWLQAREEKLAVRKQRLLAVQKREREGLDKRIGTCREELRVSRRAELERVLQRHSNAVLSLGAQQGVLRARVQASPCEWMHRANSAA